MARKITISFKETKKDLELFEMLDSLEDKSSEIKAILRNGLKDTGTLATGVATPVTTVVQAKNDVDILNF